jgi:hypothetical protein
MEKTEQTLLPFNFFRLTKNKGDGNAFPER